MIYPREVEKERQVLEKTLLPDHCEDVVRMGFDVAEQRHDRNDFQLHWSNWAT